MPGMLVESPHSEMIDYLYPLSSYVCIMVRCPQFLKYLSILCVMLYRFFMALTDDYPCKAEDQNEQCQSCL